MASDRNHDDARARYRRGRILSRLGSLTGTIGFVTLVAAADDAIVAEAIGAILLLLCMGLIHTGGLIMGEASVFLAAWTYGDED